MTVSHTALVAIALVGAVTGVVALLLALTAVARLRRRPPAVSTGGAPPGAAASDAAPALRHAAVVRYDAFGDMGGRLSFSAAILDDAGDGLVLTSINGRSETRTYAKGVRARASDVPLSPEEEQAIGYALGRSAAGGGRLR